MLTRPAAVAYLAVTLVNTGFVRYLLDPMTHVPKTKQHIAATLRRTIRGIEEAGSPDDQVRLPLGVSRIDRALPGGGLRLGCIHEVAGDEAATGFCAALLARAAATAGRRGGGRTARTGARAGRGGLRGGDQRGALLWLAQGDDLYAPGLVRFGIEAGQLLVVSGLRRRDDMLWAMEEALRCRAVRGVVAEAGEIALAAGRRLMLAAEGTGVLGLVLSRRDGGRRGGVGVRAAVSRWRVTAAPGDPPMPDGRQPPEADGARWRVELLHCRSGRPAEWVVGVETGVLSGSERSPRYHAHPVGSGPAQRTAAGSLRTTTLATSNSSSSMNAATPFGPKASGISVASIGKVPM